MWGSGFFFFFFKRSNFVVFFGGGGGGGMGFKKIYKLREKLTNALRALIYEIFLEHFYEKRKTTKLLLKKKKKPTTSHKNYSFLSWNFHDFLFF